MGAIIDPVTGVPLITAGELDQIPLDSQTFPWDDFGATARPTRGGAYPDDIFSVNSIISGQQHTNRGKLKTATVTDDNRLRVDIPASGGGGELIAAHSASGRDGLIGFDQTIFTLNGPVSTILSVQVFIQINNGGAESHAIVRLVGVTTGNFKDIAAIACPVFVVGPGRTEPVISMVSDRALDVSDVFGSGENVHVTYHDVSNLFGNIDVMIYYS